MGKLINLIAYTLLAPAFVVGQAQQVSPDSESRYPNELPKLKLYRDAKWSSIQPYVSTFADVDRILGEPLLVYDDDLHGYVEGYKYDPDWTIVVNYLAKGGDLPDSVAGHVSHITLYPKKRVSLVGTEIPVAFIRYSYTDRKGEGTVYYDKRGLRYSVYAKDSADGRFHAGDLNQIVYGPSEEDTEKYTNKGNPKPN